MATRPRPKPVVEQFQFGPWTLTASKSHILSSEGPDHDKYEAELKLPHLPEMVFPNNILKVVHSEGFGIEFNALDALKLVDPDHDLMKVGCAEEWKAARAGSEFINDQAKPFDWTYTTNYTGTLLHTDNKELRISPTSERIDVEKLKQKEKIHFYGDILLFEDELSDHGCSILNVKVRVMPRSLFVLQRLYLRVDGVLVRVNDTRVFHEAGTNYILREYTNREARLADIELPMHIITDRNQVWQHLPVKEELYEKLEFPTDSVTAAGLSVNTDDVDSNQTVNVDR